MKKIFIFNLLLSFYSFGLNCFNCHKSSKLEWEESIHFSASIDCITCHQGDPEGKTKEKAHSKNFKGKFTKKEIAMLCGNCHSNPEFIKKFNPALKTDQLEAFKTSKHGIGVFKNNDQNVATCSDCHSYHKILKVSNPLSPVYPLKIIDTCKECHSDKNLMSKYGISGREVEDYKKSVHGELLFEKKDLSAPTCKDCHGSHGAIPPGVSSIKFICGNCHILNQEYFEKSPHKKPWEENNFSQCEECHSNHYVKKTDDEMLNEKDGICLNCHSKEDNGGKLMVYFYENLKKLRDLYEEKLNLAKKAENRGIFMEDTFINLQNIREKYIKGKTLIHYFSKENFDLDLKEGFDLLKDVEKELDSAFKEVSFRSKGLLIFSFFALILAILIILKLRNMEKKK